MNTHYPSNADGDALRKLAASGHDMTKPMEIDFAIAAPDEFAANAICKVADAKGYRSRIFYDDESETWSVYCTKSIVPTYQNVRWAQVELDELSQPFQGYSDGWGTFGNVPQQ